MTTAGAPPEVHLLGVRHHGPGSARAVVQTLDAVRPAMVLVELPADLEPALRWIGDAELVPPVALLGYVVAEPARSAFAPFAVFSPEWQAVAWANEHDVPVRAIDLPLAVTGKRSSGNHLQGQIGALSRSVKMRALNGSVVVTSRAAAASHD